MRNRTVLAFILAVLCAVLACSGTGAHTAKSSEALSIGQDNSDDAVIERCRKQLDSDPNNDAAREELKRLIARSNPITDEQDHRIRDILRANARAGKAVLADKDEPGDRLEVVGRVKDLEGRGIPGAVMYLFHTDVNGHYARGTAMNERNARLFAFLKTDGEGRYEFSTIRPGAYPAPAGRDTEENRIPQHIHIQVTAAGFAFRNLEIVFKDDPRMTPHWVEWANRRSHPIVATSRDGNGVQRGTCDIILNPQ